MADEWGIALDLSRAQHAPGNFAALAARAEAGGLDMVVLRDDDAADPAGLTGLDPWTTAVWLAGRTEHIPIAVPGGGPGGPNDAMATKATESLGLLAGARVFAADHRPDSGHIVPAATPADVDAVISKADRPAGGSRPRRPAAVRARRRPGIDYDGIPESLAGTAVEPGDPAYRSRRSTYLRGGSPGLVLSPRTPAEVSEALAFARRHRWTGRRPGGSTT